MAPPSLRPQDRLTRKNPEDSRLHSLHDPHFSKGFILQALHALRVFGLKLCMSLSFRRNMKSRSKNIWEQKYLKAPSKIHIHLLPQIHISKVHSHVSDSSCSRWRVDKQTKSSKHTWKTAFLQVLVMNRRFITRKSFEHIYGSLSARPSNTQKSPYLQVLLVP